MFSIKDSVNFVTRGGMNAEKEVLPTKEKQDHYEINGYY